MKFMLSAKSVNLVLALLLIIGTLTAVYAQGRGRGGGAGGGNSGTGGRGAGGGVSGGLGNASDRSNGRSDRGLGNASDKSNGRSDDGLDRARAASDKVNQADDDLRRNPGLAKGMNMSANQLRDGYQAALANNPDLKFGQYVAANRIARNLGDRNPNITSDAILQGLAGGKSIGQTLQGLGLSSKEAKDAEKTANREIKESKNQK
ncbi:MAG: hypothetical protein L0220_24780 [Acidobacteria bacterium]|nr:hypothetical protein [Acidobacteriota bacterium]